jgi:hypothetical protein
MRCAVKSSERIRNVRPEAAADLLEARMEPGRVFSSLRLDSVPNGCQAMADHEV